MNDPKNVTVYLGKRPNCSRIVTSKEEAARIMNVTRMTDGVIEAVDDLRRSRNFWRLVALCLLLLEVALHAR